MTPGTRGARFTRGRGAAAGGSRVEVAPGTDWLRTRGRPGRGGSERDATDARPASRPLRGGATSPASARRLQRVLAVGLAGFCVAGSVSAFIGEGGFLDMLGLRRQITRLRGETRARRATIERLRGAVVALEQEPAARLRIAREQLGLLRPGEVDFLLPRPAGRDVGPGGDGDVRRDPRSVTPRP